MIATPLSLARRIAHTLGGCLMVMFLTGTNPALADPPSRPQPMTATLVGVCEARLPKLMVAIFTFEDGKVLAVDGKNMQGFEDANEIIRYAATAKAPVMEYAQRCGDAAT